MKKFYNPGPRFIYNTSLNQHLFLISKNIFVDLKRPNIKYELHFGWSTLISLSTYDFFTLYTTLPHNLIKEKLLDLIERTFYKNEGKLYLICNDKKSFFTSADHYRGYHIWSC